MRASLCILLLFSSACTIARLPPTSVTGTVRAASGEPIQNVTVALRMSLYAPLCCDQNLILQLTRTGADGTYRFAKEADWDFHFPVEFRDYFVVVLHPLFKTEDSRRSPETSQPIDMALEPRNPSWDWLDADCFSLCMGVSTADCRRAAEFHFGDKTRCNEWLRNPP